MKKWISLCMALTLAFSLAACGGSSAANSGEKTASDASETTADATAEDAETAEDEAETQTGESEAALAGPVYGATVEEQVVLDDAENGIKLTATGMHMLTGKGYRTGVWRKPDGSYSTSAENWDYGVETTYSELEVDFVVENLSETPYRVILENLTVDGCALSDSYINPLTDDQGNTSSDPVPAGKSVAVALFLNPDSLARYQIETISDFGFTVALRDPESDDITHLASEPCLVKTSAYDTYSHTFTPEGTVVYDENGITVTVGEPVFDTERFERNGGDAACYQLCTYLHNETGKTVGLTIPYDGAYIWVNGKEVSTDYGIYTDPTAKYSIGTYYYRIADPLADDVTDTYKLVYTMEIVTWDDPADGTTRQQIATVPDITLEFDETAAREAGAALPASAEELKEKLIAETAEE